MLLVTINKPASAVNVRARWSKSVMLCDAWEMVIYIRYSLYSQSVRTHTSPLLPCHKLNYQSKIVFISLEGNWKIIKNVSSPSHCASVFVLAFSHLKIPSEPNLFFSSCSRSWKFCVSRRRAVFAYSGIQQGGFHSRCSKHIFFPHWCWILNFAWTLQKPWLETSSVFLWNVSCDV